MMKSIQTNPLHVIFFATLLCLMACSDDDPSNDDDGGGSTLQCSTIGWCTSYDALDEDVDDAPPLNGGTIANGVYRLQRGTFGSIAYAFEGNTVVEISSNFGNRSGTWEADGGRLTMTLTTSCNFEGDRDTDATIEYDFAVQGNKLYLFDVDGFNNGIHEYKTINSLCEEDAEFQCRVSNCACTEITNQQFPEENCF